MLAEWWNSDLAEWMRENSWLFTWLSVMSAFTLIGSLFLLPNIVAWLPANYFREDFPVRRPPWKVRHPIAVWTLRILKNFSGVVLLCGGVLMLVLPGQGLLTIFAGLLLLDYPGKRDLERWIIAQPSILRGVNWLRAKAKQPPMEV